MRKIAVAISMIVAPIALVAMVSVFALAPRVAAYDPYSTCGTSCAEFQDKSLTPSAGNFKVRNIINVALMVLAGVSVIMVIVGGIRMAASHGDASQIKAGRETILYAVIGLVIAIASYSIVNFVASFNW